MTHPTPTAEALRVVPEPGPDKADSVKAFCADFGISAQTFYREVAARRIRMSKIAGRSVVFRSDRQAYIDLLKREADAAQATKNPPKNAA